MDKKLLKLLNEQITAEFYAAQLYLSMSAYYSTKGLNGFANWMKIQFHEEQDHALKIYQFVLNRGEKIELGAIEKPEKVWKSPKNAAQAVLEHEKKVTGMIKNIMAVAQETKDYPTINLMNWFIDEQVEEEDNANYIISQLEYAGEGGALLMLDRELALRTYIPPQKNV